jgi:hypothetical protein
MCGMTRVGCWLLAVADSDDDDSDVDDDPSLEVKNVPHMGGINRIRVRCVRAFFSHPTRALFSVTSTCGVLWQCMPQAANIVSTWADTGKVHIYDISAQLAALEDPTAPYLLGPCCTCASRLRIASASLDSHSLHGQLSVVAFPPSIRRWSWRSVHV